MRRVIFVNRYYRPDLSATSQMLTDLAERLAARGLAVHIVSSRQLYEDPQARLPDEEQIAGVRVRRVWTTRFGRGTLPGRALDYASFYVSVFAMLLRLARSSDVLIAKTDPPLISLVVALAAGLRDAVLVNWLQDIFPEIASRLGVAPWPAWFDRGLRRLRDRTLAAARINVVLGTRMRDHLLSGGVAAERIRIIENWADGDTIQPLPAEHSKLRGRMNLQGRFVVGYSGNLGRAHDFRAILDAAALLAADPEIVFVLTGGGAHMSLLQQEASRKGLSNMLFLPYQPRESLADGLAVADVHLACQLQSLEGLLVPSKCYGIFAAGRPLIFVGDPDGEMSEILRSAGCGMAVADGNGAGLAERILQLKREPGLRLDMGRRARALFVERYTADRAAGSWYSALSACGPLVPAGVREL